MDYSTDTYLVFVVLGVVLVGAVGQLLIRAGQVYLEEVFPDPRVASSVSKLLAVMFYLFALGVLGIISTMDVPTEGAAQTVVTKLGVVMLVLGIVFGATMLVFSRIRARRREEEEEETLMAASLNAQQNNAATEVPTTHPAPTAAPTGPTIGTTRSHATDARLVKPTPTPPPTV